MNRSSAFLVAVIIPSIIYLPALAAGPLGPGFTYQGLYEKGGAPAEGSFHPRFSLWDSETEGAQIGASQTIINTPLVNGVFTVILNASGEFGANAFNGEARWLQVEICSDEICSVTTVLGPRQPITGAPYALGPWNRSDQGGLNYSGGNVGIGVPNPLFALDVQAITGFGARLGMQGAGGGALVVASNPGDDSVYLEGYNSSNDGSAAEMLLTGYQGFSIPRLTLRAVTTTTEGNLGVGSTSPNHQLRISGGPFWTSNAWRGLVELDNTGAIGWRSNGAGSRFGIGQSNGGLFFFRTASDPGSGQHPANYDMHIGDNGNVGIGDSASLAARLYVRGAGGAGNLAAVFDNGSVHVGGTLTKNGGSFKIDHPLDPENKYLQHSFVESPDMMNVYNGNAVTDSTGYADISLPDWFETLNRDFRYQLTVLDEENSDNFVQAKVIKKIESNRFTIRTSSPNAEVSWQVTGIRQDPWAEANRIQVEEDKAEIDRGKYLNPEVYGHPMEKGIHHSPEPEVASRKVPVNEIAEKTK